MRAKPTRSVRSRGATSVASEAELEETAALLALALPTKAPPPAVKTRLLARVRESRLAPGREAWRFEAVAGASGWVPMRIPGVRMREITIDVARDTALLYVEMAPGATFPDHVHTAPERGLVLTGDLHMAERNLGAGDFYEAAAGTRHERIASPSGCTGLLWVGAEAWRQWRAAMTAGAR